MKLVWMRAEKKADVAIRKDRNPKRNLADSPEVDMAQEQYEYDGMIHEIPDKGGAYVIFPWDIRKEFGKGRVKVHAEFDGIPYDGSIVNMNVRDENGNVCYWIGILKAIRKQLNKGDGDSVHVVIQERNG